MIVREAIREAVRNVASGTARSVILVVALGLLSLGASLLDALAITEILDETDTYRAAGADIYTAAAPEGVLGQQCQALPRMRAVGAAGALSLTEDPLNFTVLSDFDVDHYEASPGLAEVLGLSGLQPGDFVVSRALADQLGLAEGTFAATADAAPLVTGIYEYPKDQRAVTLEFAAVSIVASQGLFDQCWATYWPPEPGQEGSLDVVFKPGTPPDLMERRQLNASFGARFDPVSEFSQRATRVLPVVAGWVAFLLTLLIQRRRLLEGSLARHLGASNGDLALIRGCEAILWLVPLLVLGLGVSLVTAHQLSPADPAALVAPQLRVWIGVGIGAASATLLGSLTASQSDLLKQFQSQG